MAKTKKKYDGLNGKVKIKQGIQLNPGEIIDSGPSQITFEGQLYEAILPLGPDHTMTFLVTADAVEANPEIFEVLN